MDLAAIERTNKGQLGSSRHLLSNAPSPSGYSLALPPGVRVEMSKLTKLCTSLLRSVSARLSTIYDDFLCLCLGSHFDTIAVHSNCIRVNLQRLEESLLHVLA